MNEALERSINDVHTLLRRIGRGEQVDSYDNGLCITHKLCRGCPISKLSGVYSQRFCAGTEFTVMLPEVGDVLVGIVTSYQELLLRAQEEDDAVDVFNEKLLSEWRELYPNEQK